MGQFFSAGELACGGLALGSRQVKTLAAPSLCFFREACPALEMLVLMECAGMIGGCLGLRLDALGR